MNVNWMPWIGSALALVCLWAAMRANRRRRLLVDLPTSKTTGVFIGLVELKGSAEAQAPAASYLAHRPCVHYHYSVQEHWSRTVTETYRDSKGNTQTRTRRESGWQTVASGEELIPFYLKDDCGVVRIVPEGAKLEPVVVFDETCGRGDPLYYAKGPPGAVAHSDHRRRFHEEAIPLHQPLYVVGQARERTDVAAAELAKDKAAPMFLISTRTETQVRKGYRIATWVWSILGLLLLTGGWLLPERGGGDSQLSRAVVGLLAAGAYLAVVGLGWTWMVYNSLVGLRQRVRQGWSLVEVQLQRRRDLIPNLVQVVQGLRDHEGALQAELAGLRAQAAATAPGEPGPDYAGCARLCGGVLEKCPELKAEPAFAKLHQNLVDTEQRIALARDYFNEIATGYNTRRELVPDRFVARLARLRPQPLLAAESFERAPVTVEFGTDKTRA